MIKKGATVLAKEGSLTVMKRAAFSAGSWCIRHVNAQQC
jgi:hypothetical protein